MINKLRVRAQSESGFTLVELLVVMLILGLLAAIAIPAFFNQRDKARDAEAKSTAKTAQTAMETYATDHNGSYATATEALLGQIEPTLDLAAIDLNPAPTANSYSIDVTSASGATQVFSIDRAGTGAVTYPCITAGTGGCPSGGGGWG
jgi:type IV pilus assembly protein PilA